MRIAQAAEIVLKESVKPMRVREIASAIQEKQLFTFRTADVTSVVSKALRSSDKFEQVSPGTYKLR